VLDLNLSTKDCSVPAGPNAATSHVPIVTKESSDAFLIPMVMIPVGLPYFLKLIHTDFTAVPIPAEPVSKRTPVLPKPLC
jgi:hypothetical protein